MFIARCKAFVRNALNHRPFGPKFDSTRHLFDLAKDLLHIALRRTALYAALGVALSSAGQGPCSINIGPDVTICQGQTTTLNGPAGYSNYLWSNGATTPSITVGTAGPYWCQVSYPSGQLVFNGNFDDAGNTGFTTDFNLNVNLQPDGTYYVGYNAGTYHPFFVGWGTGLFLMGNGGVPQNGWDIWCQTVPVCPGQTYTLAFDGVSLVSQNPPRYRWRVNGVLTGPTFIPPAGPNVWVNNVTTWTAPAGVTSATICIELVSGYSVGNDWGVDNIGMSGTVVLRDTLQVNVTPLPPVNLGPDQVLCGSGPVVLNAAVPGGTYLWQNGSTASSFSASSSGNYNVTVTANGCSANDAVQITMLPTPTVDLGNDTTICVGQPLVLDATYPGATYLWSTGATTPTISPSSGGAYSVTVSLGVCSDSDSRLVTVNPLPQFNLGNDTTICAGQSVTLNATVPGATYLWQNGSTTATLNATLAGNYAVDVTLNGCTVADDLDLTVAPLPTVDLGNDTTICAGQPLILNAAFPGATYLWQDGSTNASINAAGGGSFSVTADLNGCTSTDAANVTVNPLPVADLGNDTIVCPGQAVTFTAALPGATYLWQDGSTASNFTTSVPGVVSVTVTLGGCAATDAATLTNFNLQAVNLGPDVTACAGVSVPLGVNVPGASYLWSTGATTNGINVASTGSYWVRTTLNGCQVSDTVQVTIVPLPVVQLGPDLTVCPGVQVPLDATTAGANYLWNNGATTAQLNAGAGPWSVQVSVNGCSGTDAITISNHVPPVVDLGNDTTLCPGATLLLNTTLPGASYLWQNGSTAATFNVNTAGTYSVTVTDANLCSSSDAVNVAYASPVAVDLGNDTTLCAGSTLTLNATVAGASYLWSTGATTSTITVSSQGAYSVTVQQGACSVFDALNVSIAPLPVVQLGNDTTLCPGASLLLDATLAGAGYLWQDGSSAATLTVNTAGVYSVVVTAPNGCSGTDAVTVQYASPNAVDLGPDQVLCQGTPVLLDATLPGSTYLWNTGATTATLSPSASGLYAVEVFQGACSVRDTVSITMLPVPLVELGNDTTVCPGASLVLDATWPGATYAWSTGATSAAITASVSSTVWVDVSANGCSASDTLLLTVLGTLTLDLGPDTTLCPGASITLTAQLPGGSTTWSTGASGTTLTVQQAGSYWAEVNVGGCSVADTIAVAYTPLIGFDLGPDASLCAGQSQLLDATTTAGSTYLWDDGSTAAARTVSTTGTFWAEATLAGCSVSDTITITVVPLPVVDLGPDSALCPGTTVLLDAAAAGGSYLWNTGATTSSINAAPGSWSVVVTVNGCSGTDSITLGTLPAAQADLGNDTTLCDGAAMVLNASLPGATYIWQDGSTAANYTVTQAGTYAVTVDLGGCTASDAVTVNYFTPVSLDLGPDTLLCPGTTVTWNFNFPNAAYLWSSGATTGQFSTGSAGTIWLMAGAPGCMVTDTVQVGLSPILQPDLGDDITRCEGEMVQLTVNPGAAQVLWSTGSTATAIDASTSGTYSVTLSLAGCTTTDAVQLVFLPLVDAIDLPDAATVCPGSEVELDATLPGASYLWSTGATSSTLLVQQPGIYMVVVTGPCTSVMDTVVVTDDGCAPFIHVPNTFTPNGDGINEVFAAMVDGTFEAYELAVFDRWGERIFITDKPGVPWDGTYNGGAAQDGVYVWTLRYKALTVYGVKNDRLTGHVTLLR